MNKKYSNIKDKLQIVVDKKTTNDLAYLTHYFHNYKNGISQYFKPSATEYLTKLHKKLNIVQEPDFQDYLPIKWDIPFPPTEKPTFKFIDLFAGIGGIRLAYQNNGGKCVFTSEWDTYAKKTYEANFGEVPFGDITQISEKDIPDHDILLGGFPCQPFSIAGVSKKNSLGRAHGFLDETQGTLFFDIARIIKQKKPKTFMLENVKNLVSHDKKKTFKVIISTLEKLGYNVHFKILNGKHYVPQNRERIIIVGFKKSIFNGKETFKFPDPKESNFIFRNILEPKVDDKYTLSDKLWSYLQEHARKHKAKGNGFGYGLTGVNDVARTLSARYHKDGSEILVDRGFDQSLGFHHPQNVENRPRRLIPLECARLMGFDLPNQPSKFVIPVSDTQAYRQFGNSVAVPVFRSIANLMKDRIKLGKKRTGYVNQF